MEVGSGVNGPPEWETFLTTGESVNDGDGSGENEARIAHAKRSACCAPK